MLSYGNLFYTCNTNSSWWYYLFSVVWMNPPPQGKARFQQSTVPPDQLPTLTIAFFLKGQRPSGAQWAQHSQQAMKPQSSPQYYKPGTTSVPSFLSDSQIKAHLGTTMTIDPSLLFPSSFQSLLYCFTYIPADVCVPLCIVYKQIH